MLHILQGVCVCASGIARISGPFRGIIFANRSGYETCGLAAVLVTATLATAIAQQSPGSGAPCAPPQSPARILGTFADTGFADQSGGGTCGQVAGSTDAVVLFDALPSAGPDQTSPVMEAVIPVPGRTLRELYSIEVQFSEPVVGVDASDLLINGGPATNVLQIAPSDYLFTFTPPPDGQVVVQWQASHAITDLGDVPNPFEGGTWTYTLDSTPPSPFVSITEFMAENKRTINDEDGESSDWVEIANSDTQPVSLLGWFLTDSSVNPTKWRFPDVAVPGRGYLLVFASGKNRTDPALRLHTSFRLANESGYLALVDPWTNVVSDFAPIYPRQLTDVSYGRAPGEASVLGYFVKPTPGAANTDNGPGFAPAVEFSATSGMFSIPFKLELRTETPAALIRYTLDGNLPTNSSPVYTAPVFITNSVQVRARSFQQGLLPGPPRSESYIFLHTNLSGFTSDLPVLVFHSLGKGAPNASRLSFSHMSVFEPAEGRTSLTNEPALTARVGLQIRGSSTEGIAKSSYKLEVWDEFNADRKQEILGMPAESDWVLYAPNNFEPVLIHNPFIHQLSRDMGRYSPRTRFVEVYLNRTTGAVTSTHYAGIYVLEEKIKIGPNRLDIDSLEPEHTKEPYVTGGYLMKFDRLDPGDSGLSAGGATFAMVDPKEKEIKSAQRAPQKSYLVNYLNAFQKSLYSTNWRDPLLGYRAYVDVPGLIDYHVLEVLSGNVDALVLSAYFHKPRNDRLTFGPHWDFDRALGSTDGRDANPRTWNTGPFFNATWWTRLFADTDFWQAWVDKWQELRTTHFALTNMHGLVDRLANEVRRAQPREYAKWRFALRGGSYQSEVNLMKNWLSNRVDFIDRQLTQPPSLGSGGGRVLPGYLLTITGPPGATIYYTLDGSDPRAPRGGIAANATAYSDPIEIQANARVVARARDLTKRQIGGPPAGSSTPWSRPVAATFMVTIPPLLITEIMFHPAAPPAGSTNSASDFEFLELKNAGDAPLSLIGFNLTNAITFVFTTNSAVTMLNPGERVLIVKNRIAFESLYTGAFAIAGEFNGNLANAGDRITLIGPLGETVSDFAYSEAWEPLADGFGFSLVLRDESTLPDQLGERPVWRLSANVAGSPGRTDPPSPVIPPVRVNEVRSHHITRDSDAIELLNPWPAAVDISNWYITDDYRQPFKYRIRPGTVVSARGLLVFDEAEFGSGPNGFAFSAWGDEAFLFSVDEVGRLTGHFHGLRFGASAPGTTFGYYRSSDGTTHCVRERAPSIGRLNLGPQIGPVVISEIMFDPVRTGTGQDKLGEFVELYNASVEPVPCYNPRYPACTWRVGGAVELEFPPGVIMHPGECVVLVGFDPAAQPGVLADFCQKYGMGTSVRVIGPWRGSLKSTTDPLCLLLPGDPAGIGSDRAGQVPYFLAEQVHFKWGSPWPQGDPAGGNSMTRLSAQMFANDPASWIRSRPGPGFTESDGDGLPDDWELRYGLNPARSDGNDGTDGDPDGDGITNEQEYRGGTEPWPGPVQLECRRIGGTDPAVELHFVNLPFRTTTLLCKDYAGRDSWHVLLTVPPLPLTSTSVFSEPITAAGRTYLLSVE